jgi:hypothetical protein
MPPLSVLPNGSGSGVSSMAYRIVDPMARGVRSARGDRPACSTRSGWAYGESGWWMCGKPSNVPGPYTATSCL